MKKSRVIFNELLIVAFAGIISLLVAQGIIRFINTQDKKQSETAITPSTHADLNSANLIFSEIDYIQSPIEIFNHAEGSQYFQSNPFKLVRSIILDVSLGRENIYVAATRFYPLHVSFITAVWNPSIPIAQRKLLI